jgi:hypothetical protein
MRRRSSFSCRHALSYPGMHDACYPPHVVLYAACQPGTRAGDFQPAFLSPTCLHPLTLAMLQLRSPAVFDYIARHALVDRLAPFAAGAAGWLPACLPSCLALLSPATGIPGCCRSSSDAFYSTCIAHSAPICQPHIIIDQLHIRLPACLSCSPD